MSYMISKKLNFSNLSCVVSNSGTHMTFVLWLRSMLLHMHFFGDVVRGDDPNGYKTALETAYQDFLAFKRLHKVQSSQKKFNFWMVFKEEFGSYMNTKGYNARIISAWLETAVGRACVDPPVGMRPDDRAPLCLVALKLWQQYFLKILANYFATLQHCVPTAKKCPWFTHSIGSIKSTQESHQSLLWFDGTCLAVLAAWLHGGQSSSWWDWHT